MSWVSGSSLILNLDPRLAIISIYECRDFTDNSDPGFILFFSKLPKSSPSQGTLRLFQRTYNGDTFYCAYGPDAFFVAENVFHTNTVIKYLGVGGRSAGLPSVNMKPSVAHVLLRDALTSKQLRIELWEQEPGQKKSAKFTLEKEVGYSFYPAQVVSISKFVGITRKLTSSRRPSFRQF